MGARFFQFTGRMQIFAQSSMIVIADTVAMEQSSRPARKVQCSRLRR